MFIEKARHLETAQAIGGIVIDHNLSLTAFNGGMFSMTGDGKDDVHIPLVLMFKDQAIRLFSLLSEESKLIVYMGDENYLRESFYEQFDQLESLIEPFNRRTERWIYGEMKGFQQQCAIVPKRLKRIESIINRQSKNF